MKGRRRRSQGGGGGGDCPLLHLITGSLFHQHRFFAQTASHLIVLLIILTSSRSDEGGGLRQRHSTPGMEAQYSLSLWAPGKTSSYAQSVHMSFRMQSMIRNPLRRGNFDPPPFFTLSRHPFHCGGARRLADCKKCGIVA